MTYKPLLTQSLAAERINVLLGWILLWTQGTLYCMIGLDFLHAFDAAFDKLLWPLAVSRCELSGDAVVVREVLYSL